MNRGPWCPRRWEETPSELVGRRGTEEGGEVEVRQDRRPWGQGHKERQARGAIQEERERSRARLPCPLGPWEPAELPGLYPPSKAPSRPLDSWGHKGRWGEAGGRGPLGGAGKSICPNHSSLGSLLGSQVRSPALWDQGWGELTGPSCSCWA